MVTDAYLRQLPRKLSPYCILSATAETWTVHEEAIFNTILSEDEYLASKSATNASAKRSDALDEFCLPNKPPRKHSAADPSLDSRFDQQWTTWVSLERDIKSKTTR